MVFCYQSLSEEFFRDHRKVLMMDRKALMGMLLVWSLLTVGLGSREFERFHDHGLCPTIFRVFDVTCTDARHTCVVAPTGRGHGKLDPAERVGRLTSSGSCR